MRTCGFVLTMYSSLTVACGGSTSSTSSDTSTPSASETVGLTSVVDPPTSSESTEEPTGSQATSTGSESTTTAVAPSSTGASTDGTSGSEPFCGDGVLNGEEECDEGPDNKNTAFCTEFCKYGYCGDGYVLKGEEICDDGHANSDEYGHPCAEDCTPGARCGDNIVQKGDEECDNGGANGTSEAGRDGIVCEQGCRAKARRIFVSSAVYHGNLGGDEGLVETDEKCQDLAEAAGLDESWRFRALLGDATKSIEEHYGEDVVDDLPYITVNGEKIAESFSLLIEYGPGDLGVSQTETGETLFDVYVATNAAPDGTIYVGPLISDCDGWSKDDKKIAAHVGRNAVDPTGPDHATWKSEKQWLSYTDINCGADLHIYCIEL